MTRAKCYSASAPISIRSATSSSPKARPMCSTTRRRSWVSAARWASTRRTNFPAKPTHVRGRRLSNSMPEQDFICPVCGAEVPAKAKACPECGSDEKTGWSDNTIYDGTGIEDPEDFKYEDWKRREFGKRKPGFGWVWWLLAVGLAIFFLWAFVL